MRSLKITLILLAFFALAFLGNLVVADSDDPGCCGYVNNAIEMQSQLNLTTFANRAVALPKIWAVWNSLQTLCPSCKFIPDPSPAKLTIARYDYYDNNNKFGAQGYAVKMRNYISGSNAGQTCAEFKFLSIVPVLATNAVNTPAKEYRDRTDTLQKLEQDVYACPSTRSGFSRASKICGGPVSFNMTFKKLADLEQLYPHADEIYSGASSSDPLKIFNVEWRYMLKLSANTIDGKTSVAVLHLIYNTQEDLSNGANLVYGELSLKIDSKDGGRGDDWSASLVDKARKLRETLQVAGVNKKLILPCECHN